MNKLALAFLSLLMTFIVQFATAQKSINSISATGNGENKAPVFIDGISFTPQGILKIMNYKETKNVKAVNIPAEKRVAETNHPSIIEKLPSIQFKYAMMMDVNVESLKNFSLFGFIDEWFGTRYRMGGSTKKGIDCSALTGALLSAVYGFTLPRTARQQYDATEHVEKEKLKEGDLVFFNTHGGVSHVGVYLENDYFLHASNHGVTISNLDDNYYSKRFICGGKIANTE